MGMSLGELQELVMDMEAWRAAIHGAAKSQTQLSDWTELNSLCFSENKQDHVNVKALSVLNLHKHLWLLLLFSRNGIFQPILIFLLIYFSHLHLL